MRSLEILSNQLKFANDSIAEFILFLNKEEIDALLLVECSKDQWETLNLFCFKLTHPDWTYPIIILGNSIVKIKINEYA